MAVGFITLGKAIINTIIRLLPIGLYMGSAMSAIIFGDFRGTLLFFGFILNEFIAMGYRLILKAKANPQCALLRTADTHFSLPSPIGQTLGFFTAILMIKMYFDGEFNPVKFFILFMLILIAVWSRNNVGCMSLLDSIFSATVGMLIGVAYYTLVKDYYHRDYNKGSGDNLFYKKLFDDDFFKLD